MKAVIKVNACQTGYYMTIRSDKYSCGPIFVNSDNEMIDTVNQFINDYCNTKKGYEIIAKPDILDKLAIITTDHYVEESSKTKKRGRKKTMKNAKLVSCHLPGDIVDKLRDVGYGNISEGVRTAVREYFNK